MLRSSRMSAQQLNLTGTSCHSEDADQHPTNGPMVAISWRRYYRAKNDPISFPRQQVTNSTVIRLRHFVAGCGCCTPGAGRGPAVPAVIREFGNRGILIIRFTIFHTRSEEIVDLCRYAIGGRSRRDTGAKFSSSHPELPPSSCVVSATVGA